MKSLKNVTLLAVIVVMLFVVTVPSTWAQQVHVDSIASEGAADTKPVTWHTFVRAETDKYIVASTSLQFVLAGLKSYLGSGVCRN